MQLSTELWTVRKRLVTRIDLTGTQDADSEGESGRCIVTRDAPKDDRGWTDTIAQDNKIAIGKNKLLLDQDNARNKGASEVADRSKSFASKTKSLDSRDDAQKFRTDDGKRVSVEFKTDDTIQSRITEAATCKKEEERSDTSISGAVIYKLIGSSKHRDSGDANVKRDQREGSPRLCGQSQQPRTVNLISDTVDGLAGGFGTSQTEVPRKLVDSLKDSAGRPAVKQHGDAAEKRNPWSSTNQGAGRVGEPGSPNDAASIRRPKRQISQVECENCGETQHSHERRCYLQKYPGYLDSDEVVCGAKDACGREGPESRHEGPGNAFLYRSRSLARLSVHDSGVACSGNEQSPVVGQTQAKQLVPDLKQLHTLKQHYYPEGGWGWVVLVVGLLAQMLSHGIHGANGILLQQVAAMFGAHVYLDSG